MTGVAADADPRSAVLLTATQDVAERVASFLAVNGIACRTRPNAGSTPAWDVLVRPEDLPAAPSAAEPPVAGERRPLEPKLNVPLDGDPGLDPSGEATGEPAGAVASAVALCELPWNEAWKLARRLTSAGIPAAVMEAEKPDRDRPMQARIVPVGVRPEDVERAQIFLGTSVSRTDGDG